MTEFRVDIAALQTLSSHLAEIYDALCGANADFHAAEASLGSDDVAGALSSFCSGWKDGRKKIEHETSALSAALAGVAEDYAHGEHLIEGSFQHGGHGGR